MISRRPTISIPALGLALVVLLLTQVLIAQAYESASPPITTGSNQDGRDVRYVKEQLQDNKSDYKIEKLSRSDIGYSIETADGGDVGFLVEKLEGGDVGFQIEVYLKLVLLWGQILHHLP
ncbi:MAG: hypothetical protein ABH878_00080 [bacterium]